MFDFDKDVIEKSFEKPVVVDFWAEWCGPCKVLGPVIDKIAEEQTAHWSLVKIDTEAFQDIASRFHVRSIPNVKMFYRGEIIDEFAGALSRQMILEWLEKTLPKDGLKALDLLLENSTEPSVEELEQLLLDYPETQEIRIVFSQVILWDHPERIPELLAPIKMGTPLYDKATCLKDIAALLLLDTDDKTINSIKQQLQHGSLEDGIKEIIDALGRDNKTANGMLAKAAIGIFNTLGLQHPFSKNYRKRLDMVL